MMLVFANGAFWFHLRPLETPAVAGKLSYTYPGAGGSIAVGAVTPTGADDQAVFSVNDWPDPIEELPHGAIKAL